MAYDTKCLKMFKWLEKLANHEAAYCKDHVKQVTDICMFCGSLYATNEVILAKVDYDSFRKMSDYTWSRVTDYVDEKGYLLLFPRIEERRAFKNDRIFDDMFLKQCNPCYVGFDPRVIKDALKPFEIYKLKPAIATGRDRLMFSAHDKEVSIKVLVMGMKR